MLKRIFRLPSTKQGYTIVEILVVIVVIGILAAISYISYNGAQSRAVVASLQSDLQSASDQLVTDQARNKRDNNSDNFATSASSLPKSSGTTYSYTVNNATTPKTFCLTATKSSNSYFITQEGLPMPGPCPILYLDASISTSYPGTGTIWYDLSGNPVSHNGTLSGVTYSSVNNGILTFNGASYVDLGDYDDLAVLQFDAGNWSIFSWVKPNAQSVETNIIGHRTGSDQDFRIGVDASNKAYITWVSYPSHSAYSTTTGVKNLNDGAWHHVGAVRNGGTITLYVDGSVAGTDSAVSNYDITGNGWFSRWSIGAYREGCCSTFAAGDWKAFFNGSISNIRVNNSALSSDEVKQSFNSLKGRFGI